MKIKQHLLRTLKISLVITIIFVAINQNFSLKGIGTVFLISVTYSFILGFGQSVINDYLSSKFDWIKDTNKRIWLGIISTIIYTVPAVLLINYMVFVHIIKIDPSDFFKKQFFWTHLFYILLSFFVSTFLHARSFIIEWKKATQKETQVQRIIAKTESAKFETLKNQIDPHFLFNSLNVLTSLIGENPKQAEKFTTKLSKVYRYVLEQRSKILVPIKEELAFAETYIDLLQMRFEDAIQLELPKLVNPELKITPLSLQLLLENAVKHNVVSETNPLTIKITIDNELLTIENNINPKQILNKNSTKIGLQNIQNRYKLISSKTIQIHKNNNIFSVSLPLLKKIEIMDTNNNTTSSIQEKAREHVHELKAFYTHLITYVIFSLFFIFVNYTYSPNSYWSIFPIIGWGIGITSHALRTFDIPLFGKKWEEKKIKEYIKKNN